MAGPRGLSASAYIRSGTKEAGASRAKLRLLLAEFVEAYDLGTGAGRGLRGLRSGGLFFRSAGRTFGTRLRGKRRRGRSLSRGGFRPFAVGGRDLCVSVVPSLRLAGRARGLAGMARAGERAAGCHGLEGAAR